MSTWTSLTIADLRSSIARSTAYRLQHERCAFDLWRTPCGAEVVVAADRVIAVLRNGLVVRGRVADGERPPESIERLLRAQPRAA